MKQELAQGRNWPALVSAAISALGVVMMINMVSAMLPTLVEQLDTDLATVQWIVLVYSAANAASLVAFGRLSDIVGRKRVFIAGFFVLGLGSLLCSLSRSLVSLLACRVLQATGASMLASGNLAIAAAAVPPRQRAQGVAVVYFTSALARVIGPTVAGYLLQNLSWRAVFLAEIPICVIGAAAALRYVPDTPGDRRQTLDPRSVVTLACLVVTVTVALNRAPSVGWTNPTTLLSAGMSLACAGALVATSRRSPDPLIDLSLMRNRLFVFSNVAVFITNGDWAVLGFILPFLLQKVLGYSPIQAGLLLVALPLVQMAANPISAWLADRYEPRVPTTVGLALHALGLVGISSITSTTQLPVLFLRLSAGGLGLGMNAAPNSAAVISAVGDGRSGSASGIAVTVRHLGMVAGVAIIGSFFSQRSALYAFQSGATNVSAGYALGFRDAIRVLALVNAMGAILSWLRGPMPNRQAETNTQNT